MAELHIVGQPVPPVYGIDAVKGQARYCADLRLPGMLVGRLLYSAYPCARIKRLDVSRARRVPGVCAVLTAEDIPGENSYLYMDPDQPLLVGDIVRYIGDALAAVAAEDEACAEQALAAIQVDYEPLPGIFDPLEAMRPGAPRVWPGRDNVRAHTVFACGDLEAGFAQADVVVEEVYHTPWIEHAFLETEGAVAYVDRDGTMVVYASNQSPHHDRHQVARSLAIPESRVRVISPSVGGAFGGKDEAHVQMHAALLAQATRRPVRMIRTRGVDRHARQAPPGGGALPDGRSP